MFYYAKCKNIIGHGQHFFALSTFIVFSAPMNVPRPVRNLSWQQGDGTKLSRIGMVFNPEGVERVLPGVSYLLSVMFQSSSSSSSSSSIGDGGGLPGWKRVEWSKQSAGISLVPATEKTVEDDDDEDEKDSENDAK